MYDHQNDKAKEGGGGIKDVFMTEMRLGEEDITMDYTRYADLTLRSHGAQRQETLRMDDKEGSHEAMSCTSKKNVGCSFSQWHLVGSLLLLLISVALTATMLFYCQQGDRPPTYAVMMSPRKGINDLQVRSQLRSAEEEVEILRTNVSHWLDELEMAQKYGFLVQNNLSSVQREYRSLQEVVVPSLLYNQTQRLKELQAVERQRQELHHKLSKLQEEYRSLREKNILIPWSSDLLMSCTGANRESALLCPFCPSGWRVFDRSCYLLSEDAHTWEESVSWCRMKGGYLAVINDEDEQNFLEGFLNDTAWIGLSDHRREGNWRWVDETPYESTTWFWQPDQPDNDGDEDCVSLSPASKCNDDKCGEKYASVCERRADRLTLKGSVLGN